MSVSSDGHAFPPFSYPSFLGASWMTAHIEGEKAPDRPPSFFPSLSGGWPIAMELVPDKARLRETRHAAFLFFFFPFLFFLPSPFSSFGSGPVAVTRNVLSRGLEAADCKWDETGLKE